MALEYLPATSVAGSEELGTHTCQLKFCNKCSTSKPLFAFTGDTTRTDGKYPVCKECRKIEQAKYRQKVKIAIKNIPATKLCSCCKEEKTASVFKLLKSSVDGLYHYCDPCKNAKQQVRRYMRSYGFSKEEATHFAKNNVKNCEICGVKEKLVVDHCHISGKIRGHVCNSCNTMLGFAKDSPSTLAAAADYLKRNY
jgi:hypothetical protein